MKVVTEHRFEARDRRLSDLISVSKVTGSRDGHSGASRDVNALSLTGKKFGQRALKPRVFAFGFGPFTFIATSLYQLINDKIVRDPAPLTISRIPPHSLHDRSLSLHTTLTYI